MRVLLMVTMCLGLAACGGSSNSDDVNTDDPNNPNNPNNATGGWLEVEGNKILLSDGSRFHGRGVNIFDTRNAGACGYVNPAEYGMADIWIDRIGQLIDDWHVNLFRFNLSSFGSDQYNDNGELKPYGQWKDVTLDAAYLADVKKIIDYIGTKPGVYVMVTLFAHPSQDEHELPTDDSGTYYGSSWDNYKKLAETFLDSPHVLYGVTNEPHDADDDAAVWTAMNKAVETYRSMEPANGPHHIVVVQGTQQWARELSYYVDNPITAGGGVNVAYETHVYSPEAGWATSDPSDPDSDWRGQFIDPADTLPVIIGEYGPASGYMTVPECEDLMVKAEELEIPYIGWSFSSSNGPRMLYEYEENWNECTNADWDLVPSEWGQAVKDRLAKSWGDP